MALAIDSDKRKIMLKIGELLDQCRECPKNECDTRTEEERAQTCGGCRVYEQIKECRKYVGAEGSFYSHKVNQVLAKGPDMTRSDIVYLLEKGVYRRDIQKATGLSVLRFNETLFNYGLLTGQMPAIKNTDPKKAKINSALTPELYSEHKKTGMTDQEIKWKYGISNDGLAAWKRKHFSDEEIKSLNLKNGRKKA